MQALEINSVSKHFKNELLFDNVSLCMTSGHIYGFVGRNGSGKSVLFKMICGYMHPDSGEIRYNRKIIGKDIDFPENLGALIEHSGFMPYRNGFDNLNYLAEIRKIITPGDVKEMMKTVGLNPDSKKKVKNYSLGMKQKLGIVQAMMEKPELLVLDEPMNGLDTESVEHIRQLIAGYKRDDRCIILSSHIKEDIELLCDVIYKVEDGKVICIDDKTI